MFWQYDGAGGGYRAPTGSDARRAWVLKHLTSLPLLLGTAVHQAARTLLVAARDETEPPSADRALESARAMLNQVWFTSARQSDRFWALPGVYTALREVIYRGALSEGEISRARVRLRTCLANLYSAPIIADVSAALARRRVNADAPPVSIGSGGVPASFVVADGTTVWVDLDLGYQHLGWPACLETPTGTDATWCITDFKAGAPSAEEPLQLAVYGLYSRDVLRIPMTERAYLGRIVDLVRARDRWFRVTNELIDGVPAIIAEDMARMQALRDAADREPGRRASAYALARDRRSCAHCNYLQLCQDELRGVRPRADSLPSQIAIEGAPRDPSTAPSLATRAGPDHATVSNGMSPSAGFSASPEVMPCVTPDAERGTGTRHTDPPRERTTDDGDPREAHAKASHVGSNACSNPATNGRVRTECSSGTTQRPMGELTQPQRGAAISVTHDAARPAGEEL